MANASKANASSTFRRGWRILTTTDCSLKSTTRKRNATSRASARNTNATSPPTRPPPPPPRHTHLANRQNLPRPIWTVRQMSQAPDFVRIVLAMVQEIQPAFTAEQSAQTEQHIRQDWGGKDRKS